MLPELPPIVELANAVEPLAARAGTWVHMPAGLLHSITARAPTIMLLLILK